MLKKRTLGVLAAGLAALFVAGAGSISAAKKKKAYTTDFGLEDCTFSTTGSNPYFVLEPDYRLVLMGVEDGEDIEAWTTVLQDEELVSVPGIGDVVTRVLEEREWVNGDLAEVSRNFVAVCDQTNDVYYFGEEVDEYDEDGGVSHEGAWRAGVDGALPGLLMPGTFLLGARYFQEIAPGVAMDRGENVRMGLTVTVPAGTYTDAVQVLETSPLDRGDKGYKIYARGVGVIVDESLALTEVQDPTP